MPNHNFAQKKTTAKDIPNINYIESQQNPYLLYNSKDINTEYPNRDVFFENLIHSFRLDTPSEIKQNINTKSQVVPLSFAKKGVQKHFPERTTCFQEIISTIQENPHLSRKINTILNQTVMKPTIVHKETDRRPSSERDKICAVLIFLEGIMNKNNFANSIDQKDGLSTLNSDFKNMSVSDTLKYETRLNMADRWIMPGEMMQRVFDADQLFQDWIKQQEADKQMALK